MAIAISTGWSASRLAPRTGLSGTPLSASASLQQNPMYAQLAKALGLPATQPVQPAIAGPTDVPGYVPTPVPVSGVAPRSAPGAFSQSGNIVLPNSVYRAAPTPLQSSLAKAIGIPTAVTPSPTIAGTPIVSASPAAIPGLGGGSLPTGGLPGQSAYVSPLTSIATAPAVNASIPGVTNFNTLANQNQNLPPWLLNAIQNLNSPDNYTPPAPVVPLGGGFDPRIGATMAATEARIAAQQKELAEANKLRIQQAKAEAAAAEHAHELQVQRQRIGGGGINYQSGWGAF